MSLLSIDAITESICIGEGILLFVEDRAVNSIVGRKALIIKQHTTHSRAQITACLMPSCLYEARLLLAPRVLTTHQSKKLVEVSTSQKPLAVSGVINRISPSASAAIVAPDPGKTMSLATAGTMGMVVLAPNTATQESNTMRELIAVKAGKPAGSRRVKK